MFDNQRIKVTNTAIIVDNYTLHESEELEHPFQIFDPVTHKFSFKGFYYDEENKRLFLPAGMAYKLSINLEMIDKLKL